MTPKMNVQECSGRKNEIKKLAFAEDLAAWPNSPVWETSLGFLTSPAGWIKKKQDFDAVGKGMWRVRDGLYDLTSFVNKHPGGSDWIKWTEGTDITELFISSHAINTDMVESVLKKYFVKEADFPRKSPYTFNENDFYMTLKRKAEPILKKSGTGPSFGAKVVQDTLTLTHLILAVVGVINYSFFVLTLAGIFLALQVNSAHSFHHSKDNWRRRVYSLNLLSSLDSRIFHCISHHVFPNTKLDFEATSPRPFASHSHRDVKFWFQRFVPVVYAHIIYAIALLGNYLILKPYQRFVLKESVYQKEHLTPVVQLGIMMVLAPTYVQGLYCWLFLHLVSSYTFLCYGFSVSHHVPSCFHDGDRMRDNPDWGMCQMDATRDTPNDGLDNFFLLAVTFGEHPVHHMFPTVCHSKYHLLKPILNETMQEFGIQYPKFTHWEFMVGVFKNFAINKPNPVAFGQRPTSVLN